MISVGQGNVKDILSFTDKTARLSNVVNQNVISVLFEFHSYGEDECPEA